MLSENLSRDISPIASRAIGYLNSDRLIEASQLFEQLAIELDAEYRSRANQIPGTEDIFKRGIKHFRKFSSDLKLRDKIKTIGSGVSSFNFEYNDVVSRGYAIEIRGEVRLTPEGWKMLFEDPCELPDLSGENLLHELFQTYRKMEDVYRIELSEKQRKMEEEARKEEEIERKRIAAREEMRKAEDEKNRLLSEMEKIVKEVTKTYTEEMTFSDGEDEIDIDKLEVLMEEDGIGLYDSSIPTEMRLRIINAQTARDRVKKRLRDLEKLDNEYKLKGFGKPPKRPWDEDSR